MRKLARVFLAAVMVAVLAGVCWALIRSAGRRYQGRTERDWILSLANSPGGQWQALGPEAVPILGRALGQGTSPLERAYQRVWFKLPPWSKRRLAMPTNTAGIRRNASVVLMALPCDIGAAVPALGRALHDEDESVRVNAASCLKERLPGLGAVKGRILPDLLRAMQDTNHLVRENVTQCLGGYPEEARMVAPVLARALGDPVPFNRYLAVMSLKRMNLREAAKGGTAAVLLGCLSNSDLFVRMNATALLSEMRSDPAREVPALTGMLNYYLPGVQFAAAKALGKYGRDAASAVPDLRRALNSGEARVRDAASNALAEIGAPVDATPFAAATNRPPQ